MECDRFRLTLAPGLPYFNSRTHVECDCRGNVCCICNGISTHALTWSATFSVSPPCSTRFNFNSRTHVECDQQNGRIVSAKSDFNSRTHVECDCILGRIGGDNLNFNSRTHVECDCRCCLFSNVPQISTHALTWSATQRNNGRMPERNNFNSRTHVECDPVQPIRRYS